ncbi:MAG: hypothetical protein ACM35F_06055, partial [Betaproteobacteria bacterium]
PCSTYIIALMTIDEINHAGGIARRKLVPVVSDPASDGQFDILWESAGPLRAEPFNPYFKEAARRRMTSLA